MINEGVIIDDPRHIKDLIDNSMDYLPHLSSTYNALAKAWDIPRVDARDMQLAEQTTLPQTGDSVKGYRFYRIYEDGEKRSGIWNNYVPADNNEESEDGLHFWFSKDYAKAYMLSAIKNDITNNNTSFSYVLEEVEGVYKGVSQDEGFLMSYISAERTEILKVTKNDIAKISKPS